MVIATISSRERRYCAEGRIANLELCRATPSISQSSRMAEETIQTEGKIVAVLAGTMFRVELANQHVVLAHISGKMRKRFIRLTNGDRVKLEMSPYDLDKARITYRLG
jgi:translation initiation factor IF-1